MKILRIDSAAPVAATLIADSARRPDRRPFFLPEDGATERIALRTALRIDRLGKCISPQFASRYIGAATVVALPEGPAFTPYTDDALIQGRWVDLPAPGAILTVEGGAPQEWLIDAAQAAQYVAELSRNATFKTGDIIILPDDIAVISPAPGLRVTAASGGDPQPILDFTIL